MTTEQKAKRYDEVINRMKRYVVDEYGCSRIKVADVFPELKKSEDEIIRKDLISFLDDVWHLGKNANFDKWDKSDCSNWLAWLKKQDEPIDKEKVLIGARKDVALSIMDFLDRKTLGMCLSNMECADLEDAVVNSDWSKVYDYMKKKLEAIKEEKVDNANMVEPWTIADAKDGDVLISWTNKPFIYNGFFNETCVGAYCGLNTFNRIIIPDKQHYLYNNWTAKKYVSPATKEQRDLLFQKIEDKGYEWDDEKKELIRIY